MVDIEIISKKIAEENDALIAKAFTCQIANLLSANGIIPIMTEYSKNDLDLNKNSYKLVYELGVAFNELDTTAHDKQIKAEVIDEFVAECEKMNGLINTSNTPMNFIYRIQKKLKGQK